MAATFLTAFLTTFFAAFLAAGFLAAAFLATGFLAATFLAAGFLAATFLAGAFLATAFLAGAFLAATFLAAGFFAATFLAGAFFGAAFLAAGFFAVAIIFSLIKLQRALHACWIARSDSWAWAKSHVHELGCTNPMRSSKRPCWLVKFCTSCLIRISPKKARHRIGTQSLGSQRNCALSSDQSSHSSRGRDFPHWGKALPSRFAWHAGWRYSASSP